MIDETVIYQKSISNLEIQNLIRLNLTVKDYPKAYFSKNKTRKMNFVLYTIY